MSGGTSSSNGRTTSSSAGMSSTLQSSCSSKHNINDARIFCVIGWRLPRTSDEFLKSAVAAAAPQDFQPRADLHGPAAGLGLHDSRGADGLLDRRAISSGALGGALAGATRGVAHRAPARRGSRGRGRGGNRSHHRPRKPGRPYRVRRPHGHQRDRGPRGAQTGCGAEGGRDYSALERLGL